MINILIIVLTIFHQNDKLWLQQVSSFVILIFFQNRQMVSVPISKSQLKKEIQEMMTVLRNQTHTEGLNSLINHFQLFAEKCLNNEIAYDLLKNDYETLKLKYAQKINQLKKISKENSQLKKNIELKEQQISRVNFSKRAKANKDLIKEERPNNMFDYDLMFQRGKSQDRAVQCEDLFAAYDQKIKKLTLENLQIKEKLNRSQTQYHEKLTQNQVLKELLYKYLEDIKIGGDDQRQNEEMISHYDEKTETMSEVQEIQSYCSEQLMDQPQNSGETQFQIKMNVEPIETQIQTENKEIGVIWQAYEKILKYFRISSN